MNPSKKIYRFAIGHMTTKRFGGYNHPYNREQVIGSADEAYRLVSAGQVDNQFFYGWTKDNFKTATREPVYGPNSLILESRLVENHSTALGRADACARRLGYGAQPEPDTIMEMVRDICGIKEPKRYRYGNDGDFLSTAYLLEDCVLTFDHNGINRGACTLDAFRLHEAALKYQTGL